MRYPDFERTDSNSIQFLLDEGFAVFNTFLSPDELKQLDEDFETIVAGKSKDFSKEELPPRFHYYSFCKGVEPTSVPNRFAGERDLSETPGIERLQRLPLIDDMLSAFYGDREYIYPSRITLFDTYGVPKPEKSEAPRLPYDLHFDRQQTLKFFFYLTPANSSNGPLCVAPERDRLSLIREKQNEHRESGKHWLDVPQFVTATPSEEIALDILRGGMIALDSDLPHRQGPSDSDANRRCVILESQTVQEAYYTENIKVKTKQT